MKVLTAVLAVALIVVAVIGMALHKRTGQIPRRYDVVIMAGSLALFASLVAWQSTR